MPAVLLRLATPRLTRHLRPWLLGLAGLAGLAPAVQAGQGDDLTSLSLEHLLDTEVISAARFARQITDAASAVSVLTAQDIRAQGLRTLAEVLDQMRGLNVSADFSYTYLGARGFGGPRNLAGRVLLLIDGVPAVDNLYDQLFLGPDSMLDPALIDRIEYTPGGGSASYGNNAFLGVVHILTRRGRDLQGWEWSAGASSGQQGRQLRLTGGQRDEQGHEWLASLTLGRNDGSPQADQGRAPWPGSGRAAQWLLKGQWGEGWQAQWLGMVHTVRTRYDATDSDVFQDASQFLSLGQDLNPSPGWRTSWRLQGGLHRYAYGYRGSDIDQGFRSDGRWAGLDAHATWDGWQDQTWSLGLRLRRDPSLRYQDRSAPPDAPPPDAPPPDSLPAPLRQDMARHSAGLSIEDRLQLREDLALTLGLRADRRSQGGWVGSPRNALVWSPAPAWQVKWSQGLSTRFASANEEGMGSTPQPRGERVQNRELGTEYRQDALRLLATAYHYRMTNLLWADPAIQRLRGRGLELEGEWQAAGWRLRGSQAWQQLTDDLGRPLEWSPRQVSKLQVSAPLGSERWRLSLSLRRHSAFRTGPDQTTPGATQGDLALLGTRWLAGLDLRLGVRNLGNAPSPGLGLHLDDPAWQARSTRQAWLELGGRFQ